VDPGSRSDEQLLAASAADPEAFVALYERHGKRILAFFVRQTFDAQVAADLTAETFAQAFASRRRFRNPGPGSAESWLRTIARRQLNRFISRQRVERRWREQLGMEQLAVSPDALERAEELIDLETVRREVAAALDGLRGDERQALLLRVVQGKSYAEAAREAGCSEQALRARVSRGLRRLAQRLEGLGEERHG
jgi:RNA polymerase sigma-70 factor (ECF subfamily)